MPVTVRLVPGGTTFKVAEHETVLAAALRQGIHLPYGCHGGSCAQCRARMAAGEVAYPDGLPLALAAPDLNRGEALLCRAVISSSRHRRSPPSPVSGAELCPAGWRGSNGWPTM